MGPNEPGSSPRSVDPTVSTADDGGGSVAHYLPRSLQSDPSPVDRPAQLQYPYWIPALGWLLVLVFSVGLVTLGPGDREGGVLWLARAGSLLVILLGLWFILEGHRSSVFVSSRGLIVRSMFGKRRHIQWREIQHMSFGGMMQSVNLQLVDGHRVRISLLVDGAGMLLHRLHEQTPPAVHGTLFGDVEEFAPDVYDRMHAPTGVAKFAYFMFGTVSIGLRIISMLPSEGAEIRLGRETVQGVLYTVPPPNPSQLPGPARRTPPAVWSAQEALWFRELAMVGTFDSIELVLQRLRSEAIADVGAEQRYYDAFASFWDSTTKSGIELWVVERPASIEARLVRASQYAYLAFERRGTKWASETSPAQFRAMDATIDSALRDVRHVLTQDPNALAAYWVLLRVAQTPPPTSYVVGPALELSPASFVTRARAMGNYLPRWGGDYELMEQFAGEAQRYVKDHPRLRALYGFVAWDEARIAWRADEDDRAIALLTESLRHGDAYEPCLLMAKVLYFADRDQEALPYAECATAHRPSIAEAQLYLGHALYSRGVAGYPRTWNQHYPRARDAGSLAFQLDSTDAQVQRFWDIARDPFRESRGRRQAERQIR